MVQNSPAGSDVRRTLIFASAGFAALGVLGVIMISLVSGWLSHSISGSSLSEAWLSLCILVLSIAIICALVGPFFWWGWIIDAHKLTRWRGVFAGMFTSLVAYPLIFLLVASATATFGGSSVGNLYDFLGEIAGMVLLTFFDFAWVPLLLIGGLAGLLLAIIQRTARERWRWQLVP